MTDHAIDRVFYVLTALSFALAMGLPASFGSSEADYPRQFSRSSRCNAGAFGLSVLSHSDERPDSYLEPIFFDTMPSRPS